MEGTSIPCPITWNLTNNFSNYAIFDQLTIQTKILCSFSTSQVFFVVNFTRPKIIQDNANNSLSTAILQARALPNIYISEAEQAAVSGSGGGFSATSFFTFALVVVISMFQGAAVGSFWSFVNMLQIISYLPIIDCDLPYNLQIFLTNYLTVSQVSFPWKMLPDYIPNPLYLFRFFLTAPLNMRFEMCGYSTLSFLYNFANELSTWMCLAFFYVLLRFLTYIFPSPR